MSSFLDLSSSLSCVFLASEKGSVTPHIERDGCQFLPLAIVNEERKNKAFPGSPGKTCFTTPPFVHLK